MTRLLEIRKCLNFGAWQTFSLMLEYTDISTPTEPQTDVDYNIHLSYDRNIQPNDLLS